MAHPEQEENIERVKSRIERPIMLFAAAVMRRRDPTFHMEDLRTWVRRSVTHIAPDSPGRILRLLRQANRLDYKVISRRDSHYKLLRVS